MKVDNRRSEELIKERKRVGVILLLIYKLNLPSQKKVIEGTSVAL